MTVSILRNKITSVDITKLSFEAQLITTQYPDDNYLNYTTQGSFSIFYFENSNWEIKNIISKNYLVIDKITKFYFEFFDEELDYTIVFDVFQSPLCLAPVNLAKSWSLAISLKKIILKILN